MSVELGVAVTGERAERVVADLLVAPFFAGERPLRGAAGRVDWRLCGLLSQQMVTGAIRGEPDEAVLVLSSGRLKSPRVLLVGLPARERLDDSDLSACTRAGLERAVALRAGRVALALPAEARSGLSASRSAVAALTGAADALAPNPYPLHLTLVVDPEAVPAASNALFELARRPLASGVAVRPAAPPGEPRRRSEPAAARPGARPPAGVPAASAPRPKP
jgi:hypothetical protein